MEMREEYTPYRALMGQLPWKRPMGRARQRWMDSKYCYFRVSGFEEAWKKNATDRTEWRKTVVTALSSRFCNDQWVSSLHWGGTNTNKKDNN